MCHLRGVWFILFALFLYRNSCIFYSVDLDQTLRSAWQGELHRLFSFVFQRMTL